MQERTDPNELFDAIAHDEFLADLGLTQITSAEQAGRLLQLLTDEVIATAKQNRELYDLVADQLATGNRDELQSRLGPALLRDLADYDPGRISAASRGRERLYWLAVALADRGTPAGHPDLQRALQHLFEATQDAFLPTYQRFAALLKREAINGSDDASFRRVQLVVDAFLGGVTAARRYRRAPADDDVVTAVLSLFHAFTREPGQPRFDPSAALTAESRRRVEQTSPSQEVRGEPHSYALAAQALNSLMDRAPGVIRHAGFHGFAGIRRPPESFPEGATLVRDAMIDLLRRGWRLDRLVSVHTEDDLDREVKIAEDLAPHGGVRVHATVGGTGGHTGLILVDGHFAALGLDAPHNGYVEHSLLCEDAPSVSFWNRYFSQVFDDRRHTIAIAGPAGLHATGITELRRRTRRLKHVLEPPEAVLLTERQREIVEFLGREPRPQLAEIASALHISRDAVKKHCEQLYAKLEIPPGRDRLGPLVAELRRRGVIGP